MANTSDPARANGKICYLEIPSMDVNASADFYHTVFGWSLRTHDNGVISFDDTTGQVSGMWVTGKKPGTDPGIIISIMVDDIEATIKLITTNGGKIVQPVGKDFPEITAHFSDPDGNVLGLYQHRE